jgi:hypothetical protein
MIIYHWRARRDPSKNEPPIDDFIAFAKFRVPVPNLLIYAIVIGCLGGAGNALYGIATAAVVSLRPIWAPSQTNEGLTWSENMVISVGFMLLAWAVALVAMAAIQRLRWIREQLLGGWYFGKRRLRLFFS